MDLKLQNPHSIEAVLRNRPQDVLSLSGSESTSGIWKDIFELAKKKKVKIIQKGARAANPTASHHKEGRDSQYHATIRPKQEVSIEDFFVYDATDSSLHGIWFAVDCVQDPHNLGSLFRIAAFFGVRGFILPKDRTAELTSIVYDTACGGVEGVPFVKVGNLVSFLQLAKKRDLWILGTSEYAKNDLTEIKKDRGRIIVFGNEQNGLRRLTQEVCDEMCKISSGSSSSVQSLNVAISAGILAYALASKN